MEILLAFLLGAAFGCAAAWAFKRKPSSPPEPGVTIQGGGGPGEEAS